MYIYNICMLCTEKANLSVGFVLSVDMILPSWSTPWPRNQDFIFQTRTLQGYIIYINYIYIYIYIYLKCINLKLNI